MSSKDQPTCATGFWEPLHAGCPVCGPTNGPCIDPEYEALIQANLKRKRVRKVALQICAAVLLVAAAVALAGCCACPQIRPPSPLPAAGANPCDAVDCRRPDTRKWA